MSPNTGARSRELEGLAGKGHHTNEQALVCLSNTYISTRADVDHSQPRFGRRRWGRELEGLEGTVRVIT